MKITLQKLFAVAVLTLLFVQAALAQPGFDYFAEPKIVTLAAPTKFAATTTNTPTDVRMFNGICLVTINAFTNTPQATGNTTVTLLTSSSTNASTWKYATWGLAVPQSVIYTNWYFSTNMFATNSWLLSGTLTTPTAATAGFATPYLASPVLYTNTGPITVTNGPIVLGVNIDDQQRYLSVGWTMDATQTNVTGSAYLVGRASHL